MEFSILRTFNNYIDAHLLLTRLESEGFNCWLKDENVVTINPVWTTAVGGIKLMIPDEEKEAAEKVLQEIFEARKASFSCPNCASHNIEFINTPRKAVNWLSIIASWFFSSYAVAVEQTWHCFDCNAEFKEPTDNTNIDYTADEDNPTF
ncbi:DUF2007 domain-containing protein [Panacibacter sp. DH6]|uniref:DUF2007 domain-containing protein n=1 Tax=Panacibacter microcysteis TaxID=2793269 RepID=A0A931GXL8_9BACT|nr:DUF2007 domain-containing protein [Panacibacter microcysteis]MBG9376049.1 DUF2007 domain-containing protein [Panacibacter microcysteis]